MNIPVALLAASTIIFVPAFTAAAQPAPPRTDGMRAQGPSKALDPAPDAAAANPKADLSCDTTAKAGKSKGSQAADPRPESVRSITRDSGTEAASAKKPTSDSACAAAPK